jgi:hypothetical protein
MSESGEVKIEDYIKETHQFIYNKTKIKLPKDEILRVRRYGKAGFVFLITLNKMELYILYIIEENKLKKLHQGKNPKKLEEKYFENFK